MQQQAFTGHGLNTRRSAKGRKQFVTQALHRDLRFVSKNGKKKIKKGGVGSICCVTHRVLLEALRHSAG